MYIEEDDLSSTIKNLSFLFQKELAQGDESFDIPKSPATQNRGPLNSPNNYTPFRPWNGPPLHFNLINPGAIIDANWIHTEIDIKTMDSNILDKCLESTLCT